VWLLGEGVASGSENGSWERVWLLGVKMAPGRRCDSWLLGGLKLQKKRIFPPKIHYLSTTTITTTPPPPLIPLPPLLPLHYQQLSDPAHRSVIIRPTAGKGISGEMAVDGNLDVGARFALGKILSSKPILLFQRLTSLPS
jgi:hypothetical protein